MLALGWLVVGVGMGLGLYDSAFAALGRIYGQEARSSITGITLIAGFASTVGWPLTAWGEATLGWRGTCFAWAVAHLVLGLPLNLLILPRLRKAASKVAGAVKPHVPMDRAMFLSRFHPLVSARLSTLTHPTGALLLLLGGGWLAMPFTLLHGAGNGILTIARGTVPLAVFGPDNYGYRLGLIGAPARILQAAAPIAFGILIDRFGALALVFSSLACLAATLALLAVSVQTPDGPAKSANE